MKLSEEEQQLGEQLLLMFLEHYRLQPLELKQVSKAVIVAWSQSLVHLLYLQKFLTE